MSIEAPFWFSSKQLNSFSGRFWFGSLNRFRSSSVGEFSYGCSYLLNSCNNLFFITNYNIYPGVLSITEHLSLVPLEPKEWASEPSKKWYALKLSPPLPSIHLYIMISFFKRLHLAICNSSPNKTSPKTAYLIKVRYLDIHLLLFWLHNIY